MSVGTTEPDRPTIVQLTDPMCTWCWGSEPIIRRVQTTLGEQVELNYVMGGLVEDFEEFYDPANDISSPGDVAPHWLEASAQHGMPVDTEIFETDPARSTYPASIAFTAARQQDPDLANRYLRRLREAYATEVRNVNRREEQISLAESVGLDVDAFTEALDDGTARTAFEEDLARTREAGVRAFPTYRIIGPAGGRQVAGFTPYEDLVGTLLEMAPSLEPTSPPPIQEFIDEYGPVATREVAAVYQLDPGKARQVLQSLVDEGNVIEDTRGNGSFWMTPTGGDD
ncbi:DsbA family oxidoreductase [Haloglomus litoreum]|uniref:DsbA family oxidoreductase n=1 Tax=Haloglomus litoreum TaxID=3034026 RepID=UPI0023E8C8D7|nr:DsbA family protein [Haloglomus sp. DT116]